MTATIEDLKNRLEDSDKRYLNLKKDIEDSPLNMLRNELNTKNLDLLECERKL